jgi:hypothetical protein
METAKHNAKQDGEIPIWFFVGLLLTVYGALVGGYGVYELWTGHLAPVALARLHAPLWWGGFLFVIGLGYCIKFKPKSKAKH